MIFVIPYYIFFIILFIYFYSSKIANLYNLNYIIYLFEKFPLSTYTIFILASHLKLFHSIHLHYKFNYSKLLILFFIINIKDKILFAKKPRKKETLYISTSNLLQIFKLEIYSFISLLLLIITFLSFHFL